MPGTPYPLGATWDGNGVNFALYSDNAETVYLCLFDNATGSAEYTRICIKEYHENIWHCYIPGLKPGQLYGYRVKGPWQPEQQHLFNCSKLLLDPYARAIEGSYHFDERYFGYQKENKKQCMTISAEDNSTIAPKSIVVSNSYHWEDDKPPRISMEKSIIYEMHVKGFTRLNNHIPETLRGKFGGIAHTNSISYLKELGITAVELLPVQYFASEFELLQKGLTNYWGYNTIGFFAPDNRYCMSEGQA